MPYLLHEDAYPENYDEIPEHIRLLMIDTLDDVLGCKKMFLHGAKLATDPKEKKHDAKVASDWSNYLRHVENFLDSLGIYVMEDFEHIEREDGGYIFITRNYAVDYNARVRDNYPGVRNFKAIGV